MTVWFGDPYFHTEDNWGTHLQLLQKIKPLTDAPEGKNMQKEPGRENLWTKLRCVYFSCFA